METSLNIFITFFSLAFLYLANRRLSLPSFSQLFAVFYIFFVVVGAYYLYTVDQEKYSAALMLINASFLFFSLGSFFAASINSLNEKDFRSFRDRPLSDSFKDTPFIISVLIMTAISLFLALMFFRHGIPLFAADVDEARLEASKGGGYAFMGIAQFLPFLTLLVMSKLYSPKGRTVYRAFFIVLFLLTAALCVLSGYRAPLGGFLLTMLLLHLYMKGRIRTVYAVAGSVIFTLIFLGITYLKFRGKEAAFTVLTAVFLDRVIVVNPSTVYLIMKIFPGRHTYFFGFSYLMDFISALPGPGISFGGWLFSETPSRVLFGRAAMTPTLVGEFYANFAAPGVCMLMFLFGYFLTRSFVVFLRSAKEPILMTFWIFIAFSFANSAMLGLGTLIVTRLAVYTVVFLMFLFFYKVFDIRKSAARSAAGA